MGQHTPGPWHVGIGNGEGSVFANEGRMRLEEGGTTLYPICKVFDFGGERDANANLIAKAWFIPNMVFALESIRDCAQIDTDDPELAFEALSAIRALAQATIARAKGA